MQYQKANKNTELLHQNLRVYACVLYKELLRKISGIMHLCQCLICEYYLKAYPYSWIIFPSVSETTLYIYFSI